TNLYTWSLILNIVVTIGMIMLGVLMPWIAKRQRQKGLAFGRPTWYLATALLLVGGVAIFSYGIYQEIVPASFGIWRIVITILVDIAVAWWSLKVTANGRHQVIAE
ncbi:MAG: amino acid permease, partial [Schleiferilactobacillus harbinensis]